MHNPHPALTPFQIAAESTSGRVAFVFAYRFAQRFNCRGKFQSLVRIYEYAELACAIIAARQADVIVVREFSTFYFALFAPFLIPWLPKTVLINAHNVQAANTSVLQRLLLNCICRFGTWLGCLEDAEGGRSILARRLQRRAICLPHPVPERNEPWKARPSPEAGDLVVGLVGDFRPEKGGIDFLYVLSDAIRRLPFDVKVEIGKNGRVEIPELPVRVSPRDTSDEKAYRRFLASIHVLIVPYPAASYRYRASGILSDACSCGTPVLATALPCFERQVNTPERGGICLAEESLRNPELVAEALAAIRADYARFCAGVAANAASRTLGRIQQALEKLRETVTTAK